MHYKYPENLSDRVLFQQGYNRIYDTLEMESNLDYAEDVFGSVLAGLDQGQVWSSAGLCRELGRHLAEHTDAPGILRNAYLKGVPVYIPAFTDSELGLDWRASWCAGPWRPARKSPRPWGRCRCSSTPSRT